MPATCVVRRPVHWILTLKPIQPLGRPVLWWGILRPFCRKETAMARTLALVVMLLGLLLGLLLVPVSVQAGNTYYAQPGGSNTSCTAAISQGTAYSGARAAAAA